MEPRSLRTALCLLSHQQTGIHKLCQRSTKLWQHLRPGMEPLARPRDHIHSGKLCITSAAQRLGQLKRNLQGLSSCQTNTPHCPDAAVHHRGFSTGA